jgi:hypothetical protein
MPAFEVDASWPKLPNNWVLGQTPGIAVDRRDHVYILHRPRTVPEELRSRAAPAVLEFDEKGAFVTAWGGPGAGFDWPDSEHGIFVDSKDNVWIGGSSPTSQSLTRRSDDMLLKFTRQGKFLLQIGGPDRSSGNADTRSVNKSADAFVYAKTNELFVADGYGNRRVIVFDADTGAFKRMWGAYGDPPDDAAPKAFAGEGPGPRQFNTVHGIKVSADGLVYVNDRLNNRVQVFTIDGVFQREVFIERKTQLLGTSFNTAFSPDAGQRWLYVGDAGNGRIHVFDRRTLQELRAFGRIGRYAGEFVFMHNLATDSAGNLYVSEVGNGRRVQKFVLEAAPRP